MPNGEPGLPNPNELGDDPPPFIEGPTGGPAMPTSGGGQWSKEGAADYQREMQSLTAVTAIAGSLLVFGGGVFTLIGVALGVVALVAGLEVDRMDDLMPIHRSRSIESCVARRGRQEGTIRSRADSA